MAELISFNCRNCGAPLEVPLNAVFAICSHCGSHHKLMFTGGVLTADLVKKVGEHDIRISSLETKQSQQDRVIKHNRKLADVDARISNFLATHKDFDASWACKSRGRKVKLVAQFVFSFFPLAISIFVSDHGREPFWLLPGFALTIGMVVYGIVEESRKIEYFKLIDERDALISGNANECDTGLAGHAPKKL
jgi:hypothetical protein